MKKIIRLTENDVEKIVKKIIKEGDDFDWIEDIPGELRLEPTTKMYHTIVFHPAITYKQYVDKVLPTLELQYRHLENRISSDTHKYIDHVEVHEGLGDSTHMDDGIYGGDLLGWADEYEEERLGHTNDLQYLMNLTYERVIDEHYDEDGVYNNGRELFNIKDVLTESNDFDWVSDIPAYESGRDFGDEDICFDEDKDCTVTIVSSESVRYILKYDNFFDEYLSDDYLSDDYDTYFVKSFINYGTDYVSHYDGYDMDEDEINYIGHRIPTEKLKELDTLLGKLGYPIKATTLAEEDRFYDLDEYLSQYTGGGDWSDFVNDTLNELGYYLHVNRWIALGNYFNQRLDEYNVSISTDRWSDYIELWVDPTKFRKTGEPLNVTVLLNRVVGNVLDGSWGDWFYDEYSTEGAEEEIIYSFDRLLEFLEEVVEEQEEELNESDTKDFDWVENTIPNYNEVDEGTQLYMTFGNHPLPHISNKKLRITCQEVREDKLKFTVLVGGIEQCCLEVYPEDWGGFVEKGIITFS